MFNGVMLQCRREILWAFMTSSVAESAYFSGAFIHLSGKPFHYVK